MIMNTASVISVENLGKKYTLQHQQREQYTALRDVITNGFASLGNKIIHPFRRSPPTCHSPLTPSASVEDFWALQDVSFEVKQGDRIGIIGRNGAGKSTLLKILSRITDPTTGSIRIKGRVASLLEVGTGFHPELTGRENIFLNGAILGMQREEIRRKFDEIVDFAEIEKFLDTPVKRYSSGMYVRLAFAVAAHLEPEILIVDEVLAVGDAQFQKKCLGKMEEVGKEGRTVLFVSHNMRAITQLCHRAVLLRDGALVIDGNTSVVVDRYMKEALSKDCSQSLEDIIQNIPSDPSFRLDAISMTQFGQPLGHYMESGKPLEVGVEYRVFERTTGLRVYIDLCDDQDTLLFRSFHDEDCYGIPVTVPGKYSSHVVIPANLLGPMKYEIRVRAGIYNVRSCLPASGIIFPFTVEMTGSYNQAYLQDTFRGKLALTLKWVTQVHA